MDPTLVEISFCMFNNNKDLLFTIEIYLQYETCIFSETNQLTVLV